LLIETLKCLEKIFHLQPEHTNTYIYINAWRNSDMMDCDDNAVFACAACSMPCDADARVMLCKQDWLCIKCSRRFDSCPVCGKAFYKKHRRPSVCDDTCSFLPPFLNHTENDDADDAERAYCDGCS